MREEINNKCNLINGIRHISGKDFLKLPQDDVILLDVRPEYELSRLFDVANVVYCPYKEMDQRHKELPEDIYVVIADAAGLRSKETTEKLQKLGHKNVINLSGGIVEWERDGLPVTVDRSRILTGSCMCQLRTRKKNK